MTNRQKILARIERKTDGANDPSKISLTEAIELINKHEASKGYHSVMPYNTLVKYYNGMFPSRNSTEQRIMEGLGL